MDMHDSELKDKILQSLLDMLEDRMGGDMDPKKGLSVEVAAPDKAHLADGLDKAKEVLQHAPASEMAAKPGEESDDADGKSDAERLAELLGDSGDDEDDEDDEDEKVC